MLMPTIVTDNERQNSSDELETNELTVSTHTLTDDRDLSTNSEGSYLAAQGIAIGKREAQALKTIRLVFVFGLFCAIPLAIGTYFYTRQVEEENFEQQFEEFGNKVLESIGTTLENSFGSLDNLAIAVVASARAMNQTFPNFRVQDFSIRAAKTMSLTRAKTIVMCPVVDTATYESYVNWTTQEGAKWVDEALNVQKTDPNFYGPIIENYTTLDMLYNGAGIITNEVNRVYLPSWQAYPIIPKWPPYGFDYITGLAYTTAHTEMIEKGKIVITNPYLNPDPNNPEEMAIAEADAAWLYERLHPDEEPLEPASDLYFPIRNNVMSIETDPIAYPPVAALAVTFYWRDMIRDILPESAKGILVVVENPCSATFTYQLDGSETTLVGRGDHHDDKYNELELSSLITELHSYSVHESAYTGPALDDEHCPITFKIYPSEVTESEYKTKDPWVYSGLTVLICLVAASLFLLYDRYQEKIHRAVLERARTNNAMVSSLFPATIREKLFDSQNNQGAINPKRSSDGSKAIQSAPIAELYSHTTVMFADIAGFTCWASTRDASDVFTLLESIYFEFDSLARKHKVFKVETVGDSYMAVCGLPEPRKDHAVVMAMFCADCRDKLRELTKELATILGPGTESIRMRYGLNSGPTTGGVLRGDRSRFQLFGDTTNTASRMESTSLPNRIQATQKTADLLISMGKGDWVTPRKEMVQAKGKGMMVTYWIEPNGNRKGTKRKSFLEIGLNSGNLFRQRRLEQLIQFNVEVMENLLKDLMAHNRNIQSVQRSRKSSIKRAGMQPPSEDGPMDFTSKTPREVMVEVIPIPSVERAVKFSQHVKPADITLPQAVREQISSLVTLLARSHNNENPFHNFDHATHVAMSVRKLLARILMPLQQNGSSPTKKDKILKSTYVLTSDPLIQLAVYFSALIHDADHPGVSNGVLNKEEDEIALRFQHQSCAEQNSIVLAWEIFLSDRYQDLRKAMFGDSKDQLKRFRQIVVNSVMATDVFDADLKDLREQRWSKAFPSDDESTISSVSSNERVNAVSEGDLRATIVLEYIIQASDVVHTMQHWKVYQKWNQRLFFEIQAAYVSGRIDKDPAEGWYAGELWFFDNYIIPLAKKLKDCGVFGVSCDEVLNYALDNRMEWEQKGQEIVAEWSEMTEACTESSSEQGLEAALTCSDSDSSSQGDGLFG